MSLCHSALLFSAATHFVPHVIAVFHAVTLIYCEPNFPITLFTVSRSVYPQTHGLPLSNMKKFSD